MGALEFLLESNDVGAVLFFAVANFGFQRLDFLVPGPEELVLAAEGLARVSEFRIECIGDFFARAYFRLAAEPLGAQLLDVIAQLADRLRVAAASFADLEGIVVRLVQCRVRRVILAKGYSLEFCCRIFVVGD